MFKRIDCETSVPGIRDAFHKLLRKIQTDVEHKRVTNGSGSAMERGHVCYNTTTDNTVDLAVNSSEAAASWVGVMAEPTADGELGVMRTEGFAYVKFKSGEVLAGQECIRVFVSNVAGEATIVEPTSGGLFPSVMGLLADATAFADGANPYAWVWLGHCCAMVDQE